MTALPNIFGAVAIILAAVPAQAEVRRFVVLSGSEQVGTMEADVTGNSVTIAYDVKNNGRGPTLEERITLNEQGLPQSWRIEGTSTFLSPVDERFELEGQRARWSDAIGAGDAVLREPAIYVSEAGSPWQAGMIARALLNDADRMMAALPAGTLSLEEQEPITLAGRAYRAFLLKGLDMSPSALLLDAEGALVAAYSSRGATIRADMAEHAPALYAVAQEREDARYERIQKDVAHRFDRPVRVQNIRIFDPKSGTVGEPVSLTFFGDRISGVVPLSEPVEADEIVIDGAGRVAMPGLHDMHAHVSRQSALLYIASGVTSVRDMGNDNSALLALTEQIEAGRLAGPRVTRNGFIEGRSDYSSRNGFIVDSEAEALDAVRWYAKRGYWQIKIYNSMNPDWVPAIVAEARRLGMGVVGHVPAFTDADSMIAAGYDEITHLNQLMLGWVLEPGEDTRTPLRLTAMKRTAGLNLDDPKVSATMNAAQQHGMAMDPTAVTLELLMLGRDGEINPAVAGYYDHLPVGTQRRRRAGIAKIESAADDAAYKGAFDTIQSLLVDLDSRGIQLLPGTDDGTGLSVHRELQIYAEAGLTPARALYLGTLGAETYLGNAADLGSLERGKLADFILLDGNPLADLSALHDIAMVVKDGTIYFPAEIWPEVGVVPFAAPPQMTVPGSIQNPDGAQTPATD